MSGLIKVTNQGTPVDDFQHVTLGSNLGLSFGSLGDYLNELILHIDTRGFKDILLSFEEKQYGDEDHPMSTSFAGSENSDGVAFSVDGNNWHRVISLESANGSGETNSSRNFNLSTLAASAGVTLGSDVRIKFQQFDNFPINFATSPLNSDGFAFDDVTVSGTVDLDFGDAPDTSSSTGTGNYQTSLADDGPRHIAAGPQLGTHRDTEADGNSSANADGDDVSGQDDEDGVTIGNLEVGVANALSVASSAAGAALDYFFDWNDNGSFEDTGEVFSATLNNAVESLDITPPSGTSLGTHYARFRISTAGGLNSTGWAADGEVEDYVVNLVDTVPPTTFLLQQPADVSLINNNTPDFDWADSTDASALTYTLEIDDAADFSSIDFSQSGIAASDFSLPGANALADGSYHWRVTAIDAAGNTQLASSFAFTLDTTAPTIVDVVADSSAWTSEFQDFVDGGFADPSARLPDSPRTAAAGNAAVGQY